MRPCFSVVLYTVTLGVRGIVCHLLATIEFALGWINGVDIGLTFFLVTDSFPNGAIYAYANKTFATRKDDVSLFVIPCIFLILFQNRELEVINHFKVF